MSLNAVELAAALTIAWLSNLDTRVTADDAPAFLRSMHGALSNLAIVASKVEDTHPKPEFTPAVTPAVSVRKSLASKDISSA